MEIKWFGLVAVLLTGVVSGVVLRRSRVDSHRSLSMHLGDTKLAALVFAVVSTINAVLLYFFVTQWFAPALGLPWLFIALFFIALGAQLLAAWVPHTTGWMAIAHTWLAYIMAVLMVPILLFLPFSRVLPVWAALVIWVLIIAMTVSFLGIFVSNWIKQNFLWFQLGYIIAFWAAITLATVTAPGLPHTEAKQQFIPLQMSDVSIDPDLQRAVQHQLQQQKQQPTGPADTGAGQMLQPASKGAGN